MTTVTPRMLATTYTTCWDSLLAPGQLDTVDPGAPSVDRRSRRRRVHRDGLASFAAMDRRASPRWIGGLRRVGSAGFAAMDRRASTRRIGERRRVGSAGFATDRRASPRWIGELRRNGSAGFAAQIVGEWRSTRSQWDMSSPATSRHVVLYGPPAAGKLSVARALERHHGLRVIHNHLSVDAVLPLFDFGTAPFVELTTQIRLLLYAAAAQHGLDVVSTFVYAHGEDDEHLERMVRAARSAGADVILVQLLPNRAALDERIGAASRVGTKKLTDAAVLGRLMMEHDVTSPAPGTALTVDNTSISADAVARMIAQHIGI
jgi:hypothetical protein